MTTASVTAASLGAACSTARRGRPRDERIDRDLADVAVAVLADHGFERFSVEAVAARAGVAKTTVYRRFPCRGDLLAAALQRLNDELPDPPAPGPVRERLIRALDMVLRTTPGSLRGRVVMQAAQSGDRELSELVQQRVIEPRRALLRGVVRDGVATGELREDIDVDALMPVLVGPILFLSLWQGTSSTRDVTVDAIVDTVLAGLRPPTPASGS